MSKASEWAKAALAGAPETRAPKFYDEYGHIVATVRGSSGYPSLILRRQNLHDEDPVALACWILDTFADATPEVGREGER